MNEIEKRGLVWLGHVGLQRKEDSRWSKKILSRKPLGKRKRGRLPKTWKSK